MQEISFDDFLKVELRVGRVVAAEAFPEARKPAYILHVDFGEELGVRKSSAQITDLYDADELVGRLVVGVVNFPSLYHGRKVFLCWRPGDDGVKFWHELDESYNERSLIRDTEDFLVSPQGEST